MCNTVKDTLRQADKEKALAALRKVNLTKREWKILCYKYFDGYTLEEIAEIMCMSRDNVCKVKRNAEKKCGEVF